MSELDDWREHCRISHVSWRIPVFALAVGFLLGVAVMMTVQSATNAERTASRAQSVYTHPTSELGWQRVSIHGDGFELEDGTVIHAHRLRDIDRAYARALAREDALEALLVEDYPCGGLEAWAVRRAVR